MKKIIALLLSLLFLSLSLVSCSNTPPTETTVDRPNLTLRMAIVVDDKTTPEGIAAMQQAFNNESEVLLNTHIVFECIKASEYKTRMEELMNGVVAANQNGTGKEDAMAVPETVTTDENVYPAAKKGQFDIVVIADEEMYKEYVEKNWIIDYSSYIHPLSGTFKVLGTKILPVVKAAATLNGGLYGIPANTVYGSYQYVMLNKTAADFYHIDPNDVHSLSDAYGLLLSMQTAQGDNGLSKWQTMYGSDFSVIRESKEKFINPSIHYLSKDFTSVSFAGFVSAYNYGSVYMPENFAKNLMKNAEYTRFLEMQFAAEKKGYYGTDSANNFLIGLAEGDYALRNTSDAYYYCPIELPIMQPGEVFKGMLAVSSFSVDAKRSVEIVQELMTNATRSDLLNIALFGDESENYSMEDGCVSYRAMSNYGVHPDYMFGNLRENAYPCTDFGQTKDTYVYASLHIADLGKRVPVFDENLMDAFASVDADLWAEMDRISQEKYAELFASADEAAFRAKLAELKETMDGILVYDDAEDDEKDITFADMVEETARPGNFSSTTLGGSFFKYLFDRS